MDNHPIPQDVTGFQFRLIGDMTIKQFAYLAAGLVLAWICFSAPVFFLIKFPFAVFFAALGIILAFVPIGGRPADTMIFYFFRAVFSPTQYTYQTSHAAAIPTTSVGKSISDEKKVEKKDEKTEKVTLTNAVSPISFDTLFGDKKPEEKPHEVPTPVAPPSTQPQNAPKPEEESQESQPAELTKEAVALSEALQEAKQEEQKAKGAEEATEAHEKVHELESELQTIYEQKKQLEERLLELQKQLTQKPQEVFTPTAATPPKQTENVRKIPAAMGKAAGTPFVSDVPNLICGVVKDPRGNVLPNMLIEVKDKDNNPVRAFKTNPLGQFASATPVINGVYTITFEDPAGKQRFDTVEITANGDVLQPLEVISVDAREELRKELFG